MLKRHVNFPGNTQRLAVILQQSCHRLAGENRNTLSHFEWKASSSVMIRGMTRTLGS